MDKAEYVFYKLAQEDPKFYSPYYHMVLKDKVLPPDAQEFVPGMPLANKKIHVGDNIYADMSKVPDKNLKTRNYDMGIDLVKSLGGQYAPTKLPDENSTIYDVDYKDLRNRAYSTINFWSLSGVDPKKRERYGKAMKRLNLVPGSAIRTDSKEYKALEPYIKGEGRIMSTDEEGNTWYHANNATKPSKNNTFNNYSAGNYT